MSYYLVTRLAFVNSHVYQPNEAATASLIVTEPSESRASHHLDVSILSSPVNGLPGDPYYKTNGKTAESETYLRVWPLKILIKI